MTTLYATPSGGLRIAYDIGAGVRLRVFDGLNHLELVSQIDMVLPRVLSLLQDVPRA